MRSPLRHVSGENRSGSRTVLLVVGLVAFLVLDVVLAALAVRAVAPGPAETPGPIPTYTNSPSSPSPSGTPTPTAAAATSGTRGSFLSAVSATEAWRVRSGSCATASAPATASSLERTTDAGATWKPVSTGAQQVEAVVALDAGSQQTTVIGGEGATCAVSATRTFTGGEFWAGAPSSLDEAAYAAPSGSMLHFSTGTVAAPCDAPAHVVEKGAQQAVVCSGELDVRQGTGSWSSIELPGLVAVAVGSGSDSSMTLARMDVDGCDGVTIEKLTTPASESSEPSRLGCAKPADDVSPRDGATLDASTVALSRSGANLWLWAGDSALRSTDGGASW